MHKVKCCKCGEMFDRDTVETIQVSNRRYAHKYCPKDLPQNDATDELTHNALLNYLKQAMGSHFDQVKIERQLTTFLGEYNLTYPDILNTIKYWFEIKNGDKLKGIGIVPYVYKDACKYYTKLRRIRESYSNININDYKPKTIEVTIKNPTLDVKYKNRFEFLDKEG